MGKIPILLLAAGGSTRMGQPKQLLPWGEVTLIEYQISKLLETGDPVIVVLGSDLDLIEPVVKKHKVTTVFNHFWEKGMGGSIAAGVHQVLKAHPGAEGVLVTLVDQPLIPSAHFKEMLEAFQPGTQSIIVSRSAKGFDGVPVLFDRWYFRELEVLEGEQGARKIARRHKGHVLRIPCGELLEDMDTKVSYERLHEKYLCQTGSR